jgi:DNA-binding response OmpR family regulator
MQQGLNVMGYEASDLRNELSPGFGQHNPGAGTVRTQPPRILLVDDDAAIRQMVTNYLAGHNILVVSASHGDDVARHFAAGESELIILDLRLGNEDGLELLRDIRSRSDVPVIIITGDRRDEIDRVVGLELGADDYMTKPFGLRELLARIRAVLRRREAGRMASQRHQERGRCRFGGWQLDRRARRLTDPNGLPTTRTATSSARLRTPRFSARRRVSLL